MNESTEVETNTSIISCKKSDENARRKKKVGGKLLLLGSGIDEWNDTLWLYMDDGLGRIGGTRDRDKHEK